METMMQSAVCLLEQAAEKFKNKTVFEDKDGSISFEELREKSRIIGSELIKRVETGRKCPVIVYLPKSIKSIISFMGSLYSASPYVPIDYAIPMARMEKTVENLHPTAIITDTDGKAKLESFNLDNLRWDKVIICTDADVDGFQIRTLVLTMIYRLMPTLIEKGKVYIAESPLYEITITKTKRKGEKHFAYTDGEKEEILKKFTEDGLSKERDEYDIKRSKGLGENEPDMMSLTTMHPSTRRLIRVTPENAEITSRMFDVLLGDNITDRKEYIADNGGKYMEMLDLS